MERDVVIIGGGLTGLTSALQLKKRGLTVAILEKCDRTGGQIASHNEDGFLFESGPNTGSGASEEVMELYDSLSGRCEIEFARKEAENRWIWKKERFYPLPSGLTSGITTPLVTLGDKLRILGEPFRHKGSDPDETVAAMTVRRLGRSFLDYAVDPFLSGIYAGDPHTLVTRHALPKLYNLEQQYGSFIGGSIQKAKETRKQPASKIRKGIFSTYGVWNNPFGDACCHRGRGYLPLTGGCDSGSRQGDRSLDYHSHTTRQTAHVPFTSPGDHHRRI